MADRLPALHDAHNGGLGLEVAIGCDSLVRDLGFFFRLLQLDLVDLDPLLLVGEPSVVLESVRLVDLFALGVLEENSVLGAREGLKGSSQFRIRCCLVSLLHPILGDTVRRSVSKMGWFTYKVRSLLGFGCIAGPRHRRHH